MRLNIISTFTPLLLLCAIFVASAPVPSSEAEAGSAMSRIADWIGPKLTKTSTLLKQYASKAGDVPPGVKKALNAAAKKDKTGAIQKSLDEVDAQASGAAALVDVQTKGLDGASARSKKLYQSALKDPASAASKAQEAAMKDVTAKGLDASPQSKTLLQAAISDPTNPSHDAAVALKAEQDANYKAIGELFSNPGDYPSPQATNDAVRKLAADKSGPYYSDIQALKAGYTEKDTQKSIPTEYADKLKAWFQDPDHPLHGAASYILTGSSKA